MPPLSCTFEQFVLALPNFPKKYEFDKSLQDEYIELLNSIEALIENEVEPTTAEEFKKVVENVRIYRSFASFVVELKLEEEIHKFLTYQLKKCKTYPGCECKPTPWSEWTTDVMLEFINWNGRKGSTLFGQPGTYKVILYPIGSFVMITFIPQLTK